MATPVTIVVMTDDVVPVPIQGVVVQIYDAGGPFVTSGVTDIDGEVPLLLPDGDYDVLFYKQGVSILPSQPQRITVDVLLGNIFTVSAHVRTLPEALDPLCCRISGYLLGVDCHPTKDIKLVFGACLDVIILGGNTVSPQMKVAFSADSNGYFEFDLLRGVDYEAFFVGLLTLAGVEPPRLTVKVPDQPALSLEKLLFPIPILSEFSALTITLPVGIEPDLTTEVTDHYSDFSIRKYFTPWATLSVDNSDETVVAAGLINNKLALTGLTPGTATITLVRKLSEKVLFRPEPPYISDSIVVTVT